MESIAESGESAALMAFEDALALAETVFEVTLGDANSQRTAYEKAALASAYYHHRWTGERRVRHNSVVSRGPSRPTRLVWTLLGSVSQCVLTVSWLRWRWSKNRSQTRLSVEGRGATYLAMYPGHDHNKPVRTLPPLHNPPNERDPAGIIELGLSGLSSADFTRFGYALLSSARIRPWPATWAALRAALIEYNRFWKKALAYFEPNTPQSYSWTRMRSQLRLGVQFCRGFLHCSWAKTVSGCAGSVIFPMETTPDAMMADLALQEKSVYTVHFLHGQAHNPRFYISTARLTIAWGESDKSALAAVAPQSMRIAAGCNPHAFHARSTLVWPEDPQEVWVQTNFVHPDSPVDRAVEEELVLLRRVRDSLSDEVRQAHFIYRPHPSAFLTKEAHRLVGAVQLYGYDVSRQAISDSSSRKLVVCTLSGSILDSVATGALPLVYVAPWQSEYPYATLLPKEITFKDRDELRMRYETLQSDKCLRERLFGDLRNLLGLSRPDNLYSFVRRHAQGSCEKSAGLAN